jgi:hypothetical protein
MQQPGARRAIDRMNAERGGEKPREQLKLFGDSGEFFLYSAKTYGRKSLDTITRLPS